MERDGEREQRHADGAQRDQSVFDLPGGKKSRRVAANADSDGKRRLQVSAVRFVDMQDFAAVEDDHELEQRAEEPEVGIAHDGEMQGAVRPDYLELSAEVAKNVEAKFPGGIGRRHARNREARCQAHQCAGSENHTGKDLSSMETLSQQRAGYRPRNNRYKCRELEDAVAPGQQFLRKYFREQSIFRWAEECRLRAREKDYGESQSRAALRESVDREEHREYFEDFGTDGNTAFAEMIRQISACHGEKQERHGKQIAYVKNQEILLRGARIGSKDEKNDEELQPVVVERALKLSGNQAPEPEAPLNFGLWNHGSSIVWHAGAPIPSCANNEDRTIVASNLADGRTPAPSVPQTRRLFLTCARLRFTGCVPSLDRKSTRLNSS